MPLPNISKESAAFSNAIKAAMAEPAREIKTAYAADTFPTFKPYRPKELIFDEIKGITIHHMDNKGVQIIVLDSVVEEKLLEEYPEKGIKIVGRNFANDAVRYSVDTIAEKIASYNKDIIDYESNTKEMVPLSTVNPFCKKTRMKEVTVKPYGYGKHYEANQEGKIKAIAKRRAARKRNKK